MAQNIDVNFLRTVSEWALIAGGLDLGTRALTNNLVAPIDALTGSSNILRNVAYGTIGAAAVFQVVDRIMNPEVHDHDRLRDRELQHELKAEKRRARK